MLTVDLSWFRFAATACRFLKIPVLSLATDNVTTAHAGVEKVFPSQVFFNNKLSSDSRSASTPTPSVLCPIWQCGAKNDENSPHRVLHNRPISAVDYVDNLQSIAGVDGSIATHLITVACGHGIG